MDRLNQLRAEPGGSRDSTLDTSSPPSEAFMTANESSSKYFSLSEVDSTFDISPIKDISLASATVESEKTITESDNLISNLSPIGKKSDFDTYKIGKQIEAANILSGGVDIFDDNDNSYDGHELVIDDNAELEEKSNPELKLADSQFKDENAEGTLVEADAVPSKDTEVILQIDGKNVDAIDIGNGLYLYRKEGQEELAAVQIIDDDQQQPSFKFLKVRENNEGNLEVYEEIQIEVPKEVPVKEEKKIVDKNVSHVPIKDISKVISDSSSNKIAERKIKTQKIPKPIVPIPKEPDLEPNKEAQPESKSDNVNKKIKFSESRKSPVIGSFTPMTFHSTPNKEGRPLTKTMVDQQLHPNRHSDNVKKTIEVHTDSVKQRILESPCKQIKDQSENKQSEDKDDQSEDKHSPCSHEEGNESDTKDIKSDVQDIQADDKDKLSDDKDKQSDDKDKLSDHKPEQCDDKEKHSDDEGKPSDEKDGPSDDKEKHSDDNVKQSYSKAVSNNIEPLIENSKKAETDIISDDAQNDDENVEEEKLIIDETVDKETPINVETLLPEEPTITLKKSENMVSCDSTKNLDLKNVVNSTETENLSVKNVVDLTDTKTFDRKITADSTETKTLETKNAVEPLESKNSNKIDVDSTQIIEKMVSEEVETSKIELIKNDVSVVPETEPSDVKKENKPLVIFDADKSDLNKEIKSDKEVKDKERKQPVESELTLVIESDKAISSKTVDTPNLQEPKPLIPVPVIQSNTEIIKVDKSKIIDNVISISDTQQPSTNESLKNIAAKEADQNVKPDSSDDCKKQEIVNTFPVKNVNIPEIQNLASTQNVTETSKSDTPVVISPKKETANKIVNICNKPKDKLTTDNKENPTHNEPEKMVINDLPDDKAASAVKTDEKSIVAESSISPIIESVNTLESNVKKTVEQPKDVPKVDVSVFKDKEAPGNKKQDVKPLVKPQDVKQSIAQPRNELPDKKILPKNTTNTDQKPINNNHAPVPFGKWTDVNRQAFLNKIKESKVPTNSSNGKQIKNSNDLNRRDVLKKIDSQRQAQELANMNRLSVKKETAFTSKPPVLPENKSTVKTEIPILKNNTAATKKIPKQEQVAKPQTVTTSSIAASTIKKESVQRKEINNQDLIDKTIEGIINRALPAKNSQEESNQTVTKDSSNDSKSNEPQPNIEKNVTQTTFDAIEMKMNELHGIPFIERPAHELPHVPKPAPKSLSKSEPQKLPANKSSKIPNLLPFVNKVQKGVKENVIEVDSEEEVIEHEPITGDMDLIRKDRKKLSVPEKIVETMTLISADSSKKETIITEKDFDKFVRRNSINYENCLTVNFDANEPHHNVVQTIVQKDSTVKTYSKSETLHNEPKLLPTRKHEQFTHNSLPKPVQNITKFANIIGDDDCNKNYQSKVKMAYQTVMTAKRQLERPITIIEDRPVKVVYMDSNAEYVSSQLNVQGQELSPSKKPCNDLTTSQSDSLDSDTLDSIEEGKVLDETKVKTKHLRKQVLTPVETPELELIAPDDLGINVSPKKKRRTEEKIEKNPKALVPKKTYLLGRGNTTDDSTSKPFDLSKSTQRETPKQDTTAVAHKNTASAIDSLVKAAELLETQSVSISSKSPDVPQSTDSQQNTPVKRGRGRPRKYPLPEGATDKTKVPSPQKKPRLIDANIVKSKDTDDDDDSTDDEMIKENWTMGKINENIVCPICSKLFRSENVVFKHVKHCTGPSPSRSDSDNKSPRRLRDSQESETKSFGSKSDDMDIDETITPHRDVRKKRKSKDTPIKITSDDVIVIEDTPLKPKMDKRDESKPADSRKSLHKNKVPDKITSLVCEFCGKTFRQLSYLVNHKLQHVKDDPKKNEEDSTQTTKSVFSCETCKKEFRKLHHLVQHRLIHIPSNASAKLARKSSSEQSDHKSSKDQNSVKPNDDPSAGFRCEPCDKSFRKLHHLVEHRETHDGINRQKVTSTTQTNTTTTTEKLPPPPQCDICKKTFRKLHHLIEHKEQHLETSSEKSDDKSIKSSLSTKDIIHECSLCYMVFPNEHSLNKHTIICQRKKRQSATKQLKQTEDDNKSERDLEITKSVEKELDKDDDVTIVAEEFPIEHKSNQEENPNMNIEPKIEKPCPMEENVAKPVEPISVQPKESPKSEIVTQKAIAESTKIKEIEHPSKVKEDLPSLPIKVKKIDDDKETKTKVQETPRKKNSLKDKATPTVPKRHKPNLPIPVIDDGKSVESSDDDEIRYMLNPDYKFEDNEGKLFMKVRANKRNSLQIERPNSKDLVKRRISLQHPPKVPRLKPKPVQTKTIPSTAASAKIVAKPPKLEPVPSTDSDDSDVKYSFPEAPSATDSKHKNPPETTPKEPVKKAQRRSLAEKRKSLSSIAKRKSLGKAVGVKHKVKASPLKQVRKRTAEVEHRCDCGQLFSSAALLSRHTTLAHTPPRIRRRRSPPPEISSKTIIKPAPRKPSVAVKTRPSADSRKSSVKSDTNPIPKTSQTNTKRKSSINKTEPKTPNENRKSPKSSEKTESVKSATSNVKLRRYTAHKGVPVPEKMRKLMEKSKK